MRYRRSEVANRADGVHLRLQQIGKRVAGVVTAASAIGEVMVRVWK